MTYQRKYDFKSGTRISSSQVDEELNQLIAAVNSLETANANLKKLAQMKKITNDVGGVTISLQKNTDDLLASITAAGQGMHTVYAVATVQKVPSSNAFRGMAHMTSDGYGWLLGFDSNNTFWANYINNGTWTGWDRLLSSKDKQEELWSGAFYPTEATNNKITPKKPLSDCPTGWRLVWSDMDAGVGPNDFNWATTFVPKDFPNWGGTNFMAVVPSFVSDNGLTSISVVKQLSITNTTISGNTTNDEGDVNDVILRKVLEV